MDGDRRAGHSPHTPDLFLTVTGDPNASCPGLRHQPAPQSHWTRHSRLPRPPGHQNSRILTVLLSSCPSRSCRTHPCPLGRPFGLSSAKTLRGGPCSTGYNPEALVWLSRCLAPADLSHHPWIRPVSTCAHLARKSMPCPAPPTHALPSVPILRGWPCFLLGVPPAGLAGAPAPRAP